MTIEPIAIGRRIGDLPQRGVIDHVDGDEYRRSRRGLQHEDGERGTWRTREPGQREVPHYQELHGHEQLEQVRLGALVGLGDQAVDRDVPRPESEQEDGNRERQPAAPMRDR